MNPVNRLLSRYIPSFLTFLAVLLFLYVALRAYLLSFTHDECYSYLQYVRKTWIVASTLDYTNNHLLNTWLMKISSTLFGNSEFALRLPNLLFFAIYLFFGTKLMLKLKYPLLSFSGWILLSCNPFMLDFFSLARGYGISMGLLMISSYGLYNWITKDYGIKNTLMAILPLCIAILANLTFVNLVISFSITLVLAAFFYNRFRISFENKSLSRSKIILLITGISVTTCFFAIHKIFNLREHGNFDFGGTVSMWGSTIMSLIGSSLYRVIHLNNIIKGFIIFLLTATSIMTIHLLIRLLSKKNTDAQDFFIATLFLIFIQCLCAIFFQHKLFKIPYAVDRAVLYLIPLFVLLYVFAVNSCINRLIRNILTILPVIFTVLLFVLSLNFTHTFLWEYDHNTKNVVKELGKKVQADSALASVMVGVSPIYWPSYNYYRLKYNFLQLNPASQNDDFKNKNYQYCLFSEDWSSAKLTEGKENGNFISVRNKSISKSDVEPEIIGGKDRRAYSSVLSDTIKNDSEYILASYRCEIKTPSPQKDALVILSVKRKDELIFWKNMSVQEYNTGQGDWTTTVFSFILPDTLKTGDEVAGYIWSKRKYEISIREMNLNLLK